jgi:hypothetical protein
VTSPDSNTRDTTTILVFLSILIVLVASAALIWASGHHAIFEQDVEGSAYLANAVAFILAGFVGFCELISRYRDSPWIAAGSAPGLCYVAANGAAGLIALFFIWHIGPKSLGLSDNPIDAAFVAGFGAMVVIRSKLFTLRHPGGGDVAVGPAFVVDTFLTAVNREVDRARARTRTERVAYWARRLRSFSFKEAAPILTGALAAFQDLDASSAQRLRDEFRALQEDAQFAAYSDEAKFFYVGFDVMTAFGEKPFEGLFQELERYLGKA